MRSLLWQNRRRGGDWVRTQVNCVQDTEHQHQGLYWKVMATKARRELHRSRAGSLGRVGNPKFTSEMLEFHIQMLVQYSGDSISTCRSEHSSEV